MPPTRNVGILISGRGSNMLAIAAACRSRKIPAEVRVVISNLPGAGGLEGAAGLGIETLVVDQRESRTRVRALAAGRRVLNAFAYTGAIGIVAALGGAAEVVSVDTSRPALALAEEAWAANGLPTAAGRFVVADVFEFLRAGAEPYELIVLDPPPFVRRRRDLAPGLRGYKDVNLQALRRLAPGGWLLTSSCSQHLTRAGFREVVAAAAADAGRVAEVVAEWGHPPDHPVLLAHPEGEYLKVMLLRA